MTKEEFEALTPRPGLLVEWGYKRCRLTGVDQKRKTCYLQEVGRIRYKPIAADYANVVILEQQQRSSRARSKK